LRDLSTFSRTVETKQRRKPNLPLQISPEPFFGRAALYLCESQLHGLLEELEGGSWGGSWARTCTPWHGPPSPCAGRKPHSTSRGRSRCKFHLQASRSSNTGLPPWHLQELPELLLQLESPPLQLASPPGLPGSLEPGHQQRPPPSFEDLPPQIGAAAGLSEHFASSPPCPGCSSTSPGYSSTHLPDDSPGQDWAGPQAVDGQVQDRCQGAKVERGGRPPLSHFVQPSRFPGVPALLQPSSFSWPPDPQRSRLPPLLKSPDPRGAQAMPHGLPDMPVGLPLKQELAFESVQRLGEHCSEEREGRTAEQDTESEVAAGAGTLAPRGTQSQV